MQIDTAAPPLWFLRSILFLRHYLESRLLVIATVSDSRLCVVEMYIEEGSIVKE
jgi:hypothetical protein